MAHAPDPIGRFAGFLAQSEHSPLTIKNYRSDHAAFAAWFQGASGGLIKSEDVERLSPLLLDHINVLGRYEFALKESVRQGQLRPL